VVEVRLALARVRRFRGGVPPGLTFVLGATEELRRGIRGGNSVEFSGAPRAARPLERKSLQEATVSRSARNELMIVSSTIRDPSRPLQ